MVCNLLVNGTTSFPDFGNTKLSLDSMSTLKIMLFIFEAFLLTDCARGENCVNIPLFLGLVSCVFNQMVKEDHNSK